MQHTLKKLIELINSDQWNIPDPIIDHANNMAAELREIIKRLKYGCNLECPLAKNLEKELLG